MATVAVMQNSSYLCSRKSYRKHLKTCRAKLPLEYRPTKKERVFYRHTEISYAAMRRT